MSVYLNGIALDDRALDAAEHAALQEYARHRPCDPHTEQEAILDACLLHLAAYLKATGDAQTARVRLLVEPLPEPARLPVDTADFEDERAPTGRVLNGGGS